MLLNRHHSLGTGSGLALPLVLDLQLNQSQVILRFFDQFVLSCDYCVNSLVGGVEEFSRILNLLRLNLRLLLDPTVGVEVDRAVLHPLLYFPELWLESEHFFYAVPKV